MDPFMLRTQLERNNEDLQQFSREITDWSAEMKKKESGCKEKKPKAHKKTVNINEEQEKEAKTSHKIQCRGAGDYAAWDKYDADKECEKLDNETVISAADYDDVSDETDEENIEESIAEKDKGNNFFKAKDFPTAIKCYNRAIDLYAYDPIYFANRAMCYLKLENYEAAETDCTLALHLDKRYVKAYQRRAVARESLNKLAEARDDILKAFDFEPSNKESKEVLKRIENKIKNTPKPTKQKIEEIKIEPIISSKPKEKIEGNNFTRPKSKFALSRQQNKEIRSTVPNLTQPISDKIIERKIDTRTISTPIETTVTEPEKFKPCLQENINSVGDMFFKWPKHEEEIKEYSAIKKLPKNRSQSALKKIDVSTSEVQNKSATLKNEEIVISTASKDTNILKESIDKDTDNSINTTLNQITLDELDRVIFELPKEHFSKLLNRPVPKTSLQFYYNWKELDSELKYLYLLQINPREFVNIFKDSLESSTFSAILQIMATEFIPRQKTVIPHLYGLSKVKRFSTLTMFKTAEDTSVLQTLMEYVQQDEDFSKFTELLRTRYEMV